MKAMFNQFVKNESGQDLIEYGLLIGIITSGVVLTVGALGGTVKGYYTTLQSNLAGS